LSKTTTGTDTSQVSLEARNIKGYAGVEWGMAKEEVEKVLKEQGREMVDNWFLGEWGYKEAFYKKIEGVVNFHFNAVGKLDLIGANTKVTYFEDSLNTVFLSEDKKVKNWEEFIAFYEQLRSYLIDKYGPYSKIYDYPFDKQRPVKVVWNLPYTAITLECDHITFTNPPSSSFTVKVYYGDAQFKEIPEIQKGIKDKF